MATLQALHERLEEHFSRLRSERDELGGGRPLFALEHGLNDQEVAGLKATVRDAVRMGQLAQRWWLPLVVYASEIGYRYTGHEYWQTFEAETPEWDDRGDRPYLRDRFREFGRRFKGAQPSGTWAQQFSIICWPITHAILPTDLQFQLARLLYEARQILPELLAQPEVLGAKLAARAVGMSSRFENFAQSHDLLGQVAVALILGRDGTTPLLLDSALARIVADLSVERQARRWLQGARASAVRPKIKGAATIHSGVAIGARRSGEFAPQRELAGLSLRREIDGPWTVLLEVPDLSGLTERSPDLYRTLASSRCRVAGLDGPPLAPGRVLYPGQVVRLDRWPPQGTQLIRLENSNKQADEILADECAISSGPMWLFLQNDARTADEVISRSVHAGRRYVLVSRETVQSLPLWIRAVPLQCQGAVAYEMDTPTSIGAQEETALRALGVTAIADIEIQPTGLIPADWDREGQVEWVVGDVPLLSISSTREIERCVLLLDEEPIQRVEWPATDAGVFISLGSLEVGSHVLRVHLEPRGVDIRPIEGTLSVVIREPRIRSFAGTYREPLVVVSSPAMPSLTELWEGDAAISILGPAGLLVDVRVALERERGARLVSRTIQSLRLPVDARQLQTEFDRKLRQVKDVYRQYDYAMSCLIDVTSSDLGSTSLRCERGLVPLRWGVAEDHDGPYVRLHDNSGSPDVSIQHFPFGQPDRGTSVRLMPFGRYRSPSGGMFVARTSHITASVILAPEVRDLTDLSRINVQPIVTSHDRSAETVMKLMDLATLWASAQLPGTPFARMPRNKVMRAITIAIARAIAGPAWAEGETGLERGDRNGLADLGRLLGQDEYQKRVIGPEVRRNAVVLKGLIEDERINVLERVLRKVVPTIPLPGGPNWMAQFLLRLASSPPEALRWAGERSRPAIEAARRWPIMFCAARYFVLSLHAGLPDSGGKSAYEGWSWQ